MLWIAHLAALTVIGIVGSVVGFRAAARERAARERER